MKKIVSTFLLLFAVCGASAPTACRPSCRCVCLDAERATPKTGITRRSEYRVSFRRTFRTPNRSLLRHERRYDVERRFRLCKRPCHATLLHRSAGRGDGSDSDFADIALRSPRRVPTSPDCCVPRFHERLRTRSATGTRASVSGSISSSDTSSSAPKCNTACCELPPPAMNTISAIRSPSAIVSETGNSNTRGAFSDSKTPLA